MRFASALRPGGVCGNFAGVSDLGTTLNGVTNLGLFVAVACIEVNPKGFCVMTLFATGDGRSGDGML